jgi:hypothetical protein
MIVLQKEVITARILDAEMMSRDLHTHIIVQLYIEARRRSKPGSQAFPIAMLLSIVSSSKIRCMEWNLLLHNKVSSLNLLLCASVKRQKSPDQEFIHTMSWFRFGRVSYLQCPPPPAGLLPSRFFEAVLCGAISPQ